MRSHPQRESPRLLENKQTLLHLSGDQGCPGSCDGRGLEPPQMRHVLPCPTSHATWSSVVSTLNFPESHDHSFPFLLLLLGLSQHHLWLVFLLHPCPWQPEQATHCSKPTHVAGVTCPPAQHSSPPAMPSASAVLPNTQTCSCLGALMLAVPATWDAFPTET